MGGLGSLGLHKSALAVEDNQRTELIYIQRTLRRLLAFTGHSIDDLVNDRIVKNKVLGLYKLHKQIERRSEVLDLERQWNELRVIDIPVEQSSAATSRPGSIDANHASG